MKYPQPIVDVAIFIVAMLLFCLLSRSLCELDGRVVLLEIQLQNLQMDVALLEAQTQPADTIRQTIYVPNPR